LVTVKFSNTVNIILFVNNGKEFIKPTSIILSAVDLNQMS